MPWSCQDVSSQSASIDSSIKWKWSLLNCLLLCALFLSPMDLVCSLNSPAVTLRLPHRGSSISFSPVSRNYLCSLSLLFSLSVLAYFLNGDTQNVTCSVHMYSNTQLGTYLQITGEGIRAGRTCTRVYAPTNLQVTRSNVLTYCDLYCMCPV